MPSIPLLIAGIAVTGLLWAQWRYFRELWALGLAVLFTASTLALVVYPAGAEAHGTLSVERGLRAVTRYERHTSGIVGSCRALSPAAVICAISEPVRRGAWKGWTFEASAVARLHRNGTWISVSVPYFTDRKPYGEPT